MTKGKPTDKSKGAGEALKANAPRQGETPLETAAERAAKKASTAVQAPGINPMKARAEELLAKKLERLQGAPGGGFDPKADPFSKKGGRAPGPAGAGGPPRGRPNKMGARGK